MEWRSSGLLFFYPAQLIFDIVKELLVISSVIQNLFTFTDRISQVIVSLKQAVFFGFNWVSIEMTFAGQAVSFLSNSIDAVLKKKPNIVFSEISRDRWNLKNNLEF